MKWSHIFSAWLFIMTRRQKELFPDFSDGKRYVIEYPEFVQEWHPTKNGQRLPEDFLHSSNKKVWWICSAGHEYQSLVFNRTIHGKGCAYCSGQKFSAENSLSARYPEVAELWSPENKGSADKVLAKSGKTYLWQCDQGHGWEDRPHNLVKKKSTCPECQYEERDNGMRKAIAEHNVATECPELANEWHQRNGQPPSFYMPKSNDKVW